MNYIVMDLEWNQSYNGHMGEHPRIPFEIIEIGAVKVDKNYNIIDEYSSLIKPRIYKKLHKKIKTILNYDENDLNTGRGFKEVCTEFLEWCGDDYMFCTWGPMDLTELQTNMDFYYMPKLKRPLKYLNLQQIYANTAISADSSSTVSKLEKAVADYNIPETEPFHTALNDARYTALVMKEMKPKNLKEQYSFDLYIYPKSKEEEIEAIHNNQYEYITRDFASKQAALDDKKVNNIRCYKCNKKVTKKIKWFSNSPSSYICVGKCWHHGNFCGKIKFKPLNDGRYYVVKSIKPIDKEGIEAIKQKQEDIREKRKEKRHTKSNNKNKSLYS
ncbi:MAG: exonuclease domain-containing protein [Coprococcus sp.]|nr:exonuclease domain-containing protein [Coprococcus sp.]